MAATVSKISSRTVESSPKLFKTLITMNNYKKMVDEAFFKKSAADELFECV